MNDQLHEQLRRFLDGELDDREARRVLHAVADDPEASALLRFSFQMNRFFGAPRELAVPAGFTDRVMQALAPEPVPPAPVFPWHRLMEQLGALWHELTAPRQLVLRPVYAVAAVLIWAGLSIVGAHLTDRAGAPADAPVLVEAGPEEAVMTRFLYVDGQASSVAVAGDFTGWEPVSLSAQEVDGEVVWSGIVPVPRGEHRYMFVVDDNEWTTDPLATLQRDDGFGNRNAILVL